MSTITSKPTIAVFGGTGGSAQKTMVLALEAGYTVNALARTPSKLAALSAKFPNLNVIQGDINDVASIKPVFVVNNRIVDIVVSGIGMVMIKKGFMKYEMSQLDICEVGTKNMLAALSQLENEKTVESSKGPTFIMISTTGISDRGRDIPIGMIPLYHWMLPVPHADKKKMEELIVGSGRPFTVVRPSFMSRMISSEASKGLHKVRVGYEVPGTKEGEPVIGYKINREDVGLWIYEECVKKGGEDWQGKMVSLTY